MSLLCSTHVGSPSVSLWYVLWIALKSGHWSDERRYINNHFIDSFFFFCKFYIISMIFFFPFSHSSRNLAAINSRWRLDLERVTKICENINSTVLTIENKMEFNYIVEVFSQFQVDSMFVLTSAYTFYRRCLWTVAPSNFISLCVSVSLSVPLLRLISRLLWVGF